MDESIEVIYALPGRILRARMVWTAGITVADALAAARSSQGFAGVDLSSAPVGVFGLEVRRDRELEPGERVEIYRPLAVDPKTARRARVKAARARRC